MQIFGLSGFICHCEYNDMSSAVSQSDNTMLQSPIFGMNKMVCVHLSEY